MEQLGPTDPRRAGPYVLAGRLGAGGMGAVYLGRAAGGRTVAVKVVRPELAGDGSFRARFRQEVAAARRVSGAFTAPVVDADTEAAMPWMATAFVAGVPLQRAVSAHGPLPEGTLRTLVAGLAEALGEIHRAELIHRDLKPGNVLLALDGPHVIDFGISRAADDTGLTTTGSVIGSAPFMSPEQALGEPLTPASDVFSLGSTVAHAALGRPLFGEGVAAAVLFRVVNTEPDLGGLPDGLRHLVAGCLAKNPAHRPTPRQLVELVERTGRPQTFGGWLPPGVAADVLAVRRLLTAPQPGPHPGVPPVADGPVLPAPTVPDVPDLPPAPDGPERRPPRRALLLGLGIGGGVLAAGGTVAAVVVRQRRRTPSAGAPSGGTPSGTAQAVDRPTGADVKEGVLSWKTSPPESCSQALAAGELVVGVGEGTLTAFDRHGTAAWTFDGRAAGLILATTRIPGRRAVLDGGLLYTGATRMAAVTEAGQPAVSTTTVLLAVDPATGKEAWRAETEGFRTVGVLQVLGVRAGRAYLFGLGDGTGKATGGHVWAVDLAARRTAWFRGLDGYALFGALPPEGDRLLVGGDRTVQGLDGDGRTAWSRDTALAGFGAVGGRFLTVVDGVLSALDASTGEPVWTVPGVLPTTGGSGNAVAASEDGTLLFCQLKDTDGGSSLGTLDAATGVVRRRTPLPPESDRGLPAAARLQCADGNVYRLGADAVLWALDPADGRPRWKFTVLRGTDPQNLSWTAGGGRVCLADRSAGTVASLFANGA
ncbi:PQQ-binding-like beta-propeller repeat protein [Kitasatospora sp. MBT66]|uniref:protein kinase domain-containing protein n=1 Tax=Kitasatospora sp. MBT66 TaxID=1444769 RepID=UPI0006893489|nr:PQQ-binding-like beta-propeller repeat protein [Kitasatospora sp. MBT66]